MTIIGEFIIYTQSTIYFDCIPYKKCLKGFTQAVVESYLLLLVFLFLTLAAATEIPSSVYPFLPIHGQLRVDRSTNLKKQREVTAAASLLANLYAFQWGGLNPPVCLRARENKAFT